MFFRPLAGKKRILNKAHTLPDLHHRFRRLQASLNGSLLLFLILLVDVKMIVKIAALLIWILRKPYMLTDKSLYKKSFSVFYSVLAGLTVLHILLSLLHFQLSYLIAASLGLAGWLLCLFSGFIIRNEIRQTDTGTLHKTISAFFSANMIFTALQLLLIILDARSINPFTYQGMHQKYFIGTGDLLTGISMDVSTTNAIFSGMGVLYFLQRKQWLLMLGSMACMLITASNITLLFLLITLAFQFIWQSDKNQKSLLLVCAVFVVIFMVKISPQNNKYVTEAWGKLLGWQKKTPATVETLIQIHDKPDSLLNPEQRLQKKVMLSLDSEALAQKPVNPPPALILPAKTPQKIILTDSHKPVLPKDSIHTESFQRRHDTSVYQHRLLDFAKQYVPAVDTSLYKIKTTRLPGKIRAMEQTIHWLQHHPLAALIGTGTGNFSSKLAFRTTALGIAGGYPISQRYIHPAFLENHLALYLDYFSKDIEIHSVVNNPGSVYDQLLGEYGAAGMAAFLIFYAGFCWKRRKQIPYTIPLCLFTFLCLGVDYWFEQVSIVLVFETLLLTALKEQKGEEYV